VSRLATLLIAGTIGISAQAPQTPTRSATPGTPPPLAAAPDTPSTIHGRVVAAETGRPLNRARVHLNRAGNDGKGVSRQALTDRDGRYRFENVPPGRYFIESSSASYLGMRAGQKHPGGPADLWEVLPGQVQQLDFDLPRGGVITGRITDDAGEPLVGADVTPLRVEHSMSGTQLRPSYGADGSNRTDDRGAFRLAGLRPGTYVVAVRVQSDAVGEGYAPTYCPGTKSLREARRFTVGANEEVAVSFSVMGTRLVRVSGQVRSSTGSLLKSHRAVLATETGIGWIGSTITDTGAFEFKGVAPGRYRLEVGADERPGQETPSEFAVIPLEIDEEDVTGLQISTGRGVALSGRVIFDGTAPALTSPHKPRAYVTLLDRSSTFWRPVIDRNNGLIGADGSFTIPGTYGRVLFWIDLPGWQIKSVMLDGVDITEFPYDTARGGTDRLEITATDQKQSVQGRVVDPFGKPAAEFVVIVFPGGSKAGGLRANRYVPVSAARNSDGAFDVPYLRPGDYFAAALSWAPADAAYDLEFLEALKPRATPFQLAPGETAKIELTLIE
jgi:protocatechuate 3,4-dioxygenase beta subunit